MNSAQGRPPARPFFLGTPLGKRFCLYHTPPPGRICAGAILYVHPFGEEMNMARRMTARQSRAFADAGYGVLQIDLFGCGDSEGELRDATWEIWRQDLATATDWLRTHVSPAISLWGLRLGAALALDIAHSGNLPIQRCILWQPVLAGKPYMTQFLRYRIAGEMLASSNEDSGGTQGLRKALMRGETVEVSGYELSPVLVAGIDGIDLTRLKSAACPVHWFELVSDDHTLMPAGRMNLARDWVDRGIDLRLHAVTGPAFWGTREVAECPRLVAETTGLLVEEMA